MAIKSVFKPEGSVLMGAVTAILVVAMHNQVAGTTAVMHATKANDGNIDAARKKAIWAETTVVAAISLLTRDANVFILGEGVAVALDFMDRHANATAPDTGQLVSDNTPSRGRLSAVPASGY